MSQLQPHKKQELSVRDQQLIRKCETLSHLSLVNEAVQELTLARATDPQALTVLSLARLKGFDYACAVVIKWLTEADAVTGGKTSADEIATLAQMTLRHMKHRSVGSIAMAIRDGIGYTDDNARIYGSITWVKLSIWLDRHEQAVLSIAADQHSRSVVKNDNTGKDWMDQMDKF